MISKIFGLVFERAGLALAALVAFAAILWRTWSGGAKRERERQEARRNAELAQAQQRRIDTIKTAQDTRDETDATTDDDVSRRLRNWTRPDN